MKVYKITISGRRADALKLFDFLKHFLWENDDYDAVHIFYWMTQRYQTPKYTKLVKRPLVILNDRIQR